MPNVAIDKDLKSLVQDMGALMDATPIDDPDYENVKKQYQKASDLLAKAIEKAIDEADQDYQDFTKEMKLAIKAIKDVQEKIKKLAEVIVQVAQVIDIAGKVVGKLV